MRIDAVQQRWLRMVRGDPTPVGVGDLIIEPDERTSGRPLATSTEPSTGSSKTSSPSRSRSALRGEREEDAALPVSWRRWTPVIQRARR
jgi:hypothetical protein